MKIYNFDKDGALTTDAEAKRDPLESAKKKKDIFLIPANATDIAPPTAGENEVAVFKDKKWSIAEDHRGASFYIPGNPDQLKMVGLGALPDDAVLGDNPAIKEAEDEALAAIDALWDAFDSSTTIAQLKAALKPILGRE